MNKVLFVTAVGGDIANAALRCIRRGYLCSRVVGCDIQPYVQGVDYVDDLFIVPPYREEDRYLSHIRQICLDQKVTHFFPMSEPEILIADKHRAFFAENHIRLLIQSKEVLEVASSKYETARFLRANGIAAPETYMKNRYEGQLGFPVIVKADRGCGSRGLHVVRSREDWDALAPLDSRNFVVQAYIGDAEHEYTTGVFSDGATVRSITFKRVLGLGGMSVRVETVKDAAIDEIARRAAHALRLHGSINIQTRLTPQGHSVFEINPRISSTAGFRDKMGFHDVVWWLRHADGERIDSVEPVPPGLVGIKTLDEKVFLPDSVEPPEP